MENNLNLETPLENRCHQQSIRLHQGVVYGGGMVMLDQVERTTQVLSENTLLTHKDREDAICASLLHKCFETKRIAKDVSPLSLTDVYNLAGTKVAKIVAQLASEPEEDKSKTKMEQWQEKAEWAKTLCPAAQEILLAEKIVNYETSRDKPNMNKPLEWHKEYYETRHLMVEALKTVNPKMYQLACQIKKEGLYKIAQKQQQIQQSKQAER